LLFRAPTVGRDAEFFNQIRDLEKIRGGAGVLVCLLDFKSTYSEKSQNGRFDSYAPPPEYREQGIGYRKQWKKSKDIYTVSF
jgi:hypothetical protein